jgi:hypothetical protein
MAPNPSIERTPYSWLRQLQAASQTLGGKILQMRILVCYSAVLVLVLALVAACATPAPKAAADNVLGKNFTAPPVGALIVLLPPPQTKEVEAGESFMTAQLGAQLQAAGYRVATLTRPNYSDIWSQEVAAVGGVFDQTTGASKAEVYALALSNLARRVCDEAKCAMVIQQRLIPRTAKLDGSVADWDGQSRSILVKNAHSREFRFSGTTKALSIELLAVMANGGMGFRTYGGASLLYQTDVQESVNVLRPNLFSNDREVADGVRIALQPLLGK